MSIRALRALMSVLAALPPACGMALGRVLGRVAHGVALRRRRIAARNVALCLPEMSGADRDALVRANFEATGVAIVETAKAWSRPPEHWTGRLDVVGAPLFEAALSGDRGLLLAGCHMVTLEMCGALLSTLAPVAVVQRAHDSPVLDAIQRAARTRLYAEVIDRDDLRRMLRHLRAGGCVWYAADQDPGPDRGRFVPFFDVATATLDTTARIARATDADVLFVDHWRDPAHGRWTLRFTRLPAPWPSDDTHRDTVALNRAIEVAVRDHPDQYLWMHRRFKTRPDGLPDPYA